MIVFKDIANLSKHIQSFKNDGMVVGLVPTMGALHEGHLSLVRRSNDQVDITVASIFINPTQFNDPKDFENYPVTIERDKEILEREDCDILFLPTISEIYPHGIKPAMHYELGDMEILLEGKYRPGHFQGVAQVVHRLLDIATPDYLFLGSKDYQQCMVIEQLVRIIQSPTKVIIGNTFREQTGLAMSSRNMRLSQQHKEAATAIYKALIHIKENYKRVPFLQLEAEAKQHLIEHGFNKVDYISIADSKTLQPAAPGQQQNLIALVAAFIENVRLIDNMMIAE